MIWRLFRHNVSVDKMRKQWCHSTISGLIGLAFFLWTLLLPTCFYVHCSWNVGPIPTPNRDPRKLRVSVWVSECVCVMLCHRVALSAFTFDMADLSIGALWLLIIKSVIAVVSFKRFETFYFNGHGFFISSHNIPFICAVNAAPLEWSIFVFRWKIEKLLCQRASTFENTKGRKCDVCYVVPVLIYASENSLPLLSALERNFHRYDVYCVPLNINEKHIVCASTCFSFNDTENIC